MVAVILLGLDESLGSDKCVPSNYRTVSLQARQQNDQNDMEHLFT